jgi:hypothetical protein
VVVQLLISVARFVRSALTAVPRGFAAWHAAAAGVEQSAEAKGLLLMRQWLSDEQREQFDRTETFKVQGSDSRKCYLIRNKTGTNVFELDDNGRAIRGFCFAPCGNLARGDVMLAQKIALETGEKDALAVANSFPVQRHDNDVPLHLIRRAY